LDRWKRLSTEARRLSDDIVVVIGDDHEPWIDRRHLGPQGGVGVQQWRPQAKARRAERTRGTQDRTLSLLDSLKRTYPDRFDNLDPPNRTFTTFERVIDSSVASAHVGVDVDDNGAVQLRYGERSVRLLEEVLRDLRKTGSEKLTSRKIHDQDDINNYMDELDARLDSNLSTSPITLDAASASRPARAAKKSASRTRAKDVLNDYDRTSAARPTKLIEELKKVRRLKLANAAIVLTRVLFELSADHYAAEESLSFAGDRNIEMEEEIKDFRRQLGVAGIRPSKSITRALDLAATRPLSLGIKLELVIKDLMDKKRIDRKEGNAKIRELTEKTVIELLNDAVHRLENVPSVPRVDHILEVMKPVYNAMVA
jgi:hypothetical protein